MSDKKEIVGLVIGWGACIPWKNVSNTIENNDDSLDGVRKFLSGESYAHAYLLEDRSGVFIVSKNNLILYDANDTNEDVPADQDSDAGNACSLFDVSAELKIVSCFIDAIQKTD